MRLIGINTPELARDRRPAEPLGAAARDALRRLIAASDGRVGLRYDGERHDRFGRTLAHVFTRDGDNLAAALLRDGLAAAIAVPPNLWQQPCYARAAAAARARGDGIWSLARYRGTPLARLPRGAAGFWTVEGRVRSVRRSRSALWIDLGRGFALRLRLDDLVHFAGIDPGAWRHREVRASGWISHRQGGRRMGLRHPSQLEIIR